MRQDKKDSTNMWISNVIIVNRKFKLHCNIPYSDHLVRNNIYNITNVNNLVSLNNRDEHDDP